VLDGPRRRLRPPLAAGHGPPLRLPLVIRRRRRVDIHHDGFREGVLVDGFRTEVAPVSGLADTAKGRRRTHTLIRIDPNHSGSNRIRHAMTALKVASPQPAAKTILRGIRDSDDFLLILEPRD